MPIFSKEREVPIVDVEGVEPLAERREKLPGEEGYIERVEKEAELKKPITYRGQVLVTSRQAAPITIVLPVTAATFANPKNWVKPITFAIRWLLEFVKRQIKKYPGQAQFRT